VQVQQEHVQVVVQVYQLVMALHLQHHQKHARGRRVE
jgi:hypothetical protein